MHPIENIMRASMEQIKGMVDVNTVIGDPVMIDDRTMILPVSKVSLAFLVGGGEYGNMSTAKKSSDEARVGEYPLAGASAVGMSISPLAFLTVEDGNVRVLPAAQKCVVDRLVDMVPQVLKGFDRIINAGIECLCRKSKCGEGSGKEQKKCCAHDNESASEAETEQSGGTEN